MKNKITVEDIEREMGDRVIQTIQLHDKPVTIVEVRMTNGFTVRHTTTCVDPKNYDESLGAEVCLKHIEDKVWLLLGYELQTKLFGEK